MKQHFYFVHICTVAVTENGHFTFYPANLQGKSYSKTLVSVALIKGVKGFFIFCFQTENGPSGEKTYVFLEWLKDKMAAVWRTFLDRMGNVFFQSFQIIFYREGTRNRPCKTDTPAFFASVTILLRACTLRQILTLQSRAYSSESWYFMACFVRLILSYPFQIEIKPAEKLSKASTITEFTQPPTQWSRVCGKPKTHITISYGACFSFKSITFINSVSIDDYLVTFASTKILIL